MTRTRRLLAAAALIATLTGCATAAPEPPPAPEGEATAVGPLTVTAPGYWDVTDPGDGHVRVRAAGCPDAATCPAFDLLHGSALTGLDPEVAHLGSEARCPGGDALAAGDPIILSVDDVEVAGLAATLTRFEVSCTDGAGTLIRMAAHHQWYLPESPAGPLMVTDRWAFEGLAERLATATF